MNSLVPERSNFVAGIWSQGFTDYCTRFKGAVRFGNVANDLTTLLHMHPPLFKSSVPPVLQFPLPDYGELGLHHIQSYNPVSESHRLHKHDLANFGWLVTVLLFVSISAIALLID